MERLTDKNHNAVNSCGEYSSCYSCNKEKCYISELADKLGKFEDFMEEQGFESLEELKDSYETIKKSQASSHSTLMIINKELVKARQIIARHTIENQALKDRWEKLKEFVNTFKESDIKETNLVWRITNKIKELEEEKRK